MADKMIPRERVMTALKGGIPDRVPWVEGYVHPSLVNKILGREVQPTRLTTRQRQILTQLGFSTPAKILSRQLPRAP